MASNGWMSTKPHHVQDLEDSKVMSSGWDSFSEGPIGDIFAQNDVTDSLDLRAGIGPIFWQVVVQKKVDHVLEKIGQCDATLVSILWRALATC